MKIDRIKKLLLLISILLGSLFICGWLYADMMDREDIRARESSAPQRAEAVAEARASYQPIIVADEVPKPKVDTAVATTDNLNDRAAVTERACQLADDDAIVVIPAPAVTPAPTQPPAPAPTSPPPTQAPGGGDKGPTPGNGNGEGPID